MVNRYYGWYLGFDLAGGRRARGRAAGVGRQARHADHRHRVRRRRGGRHPLASESNPWSEEYQADLLDTYHQVFDRIDAVVGEHVWNFADFATAPSFMRVDGNKKGVFTRDRRPKVAAHRLRRRWRDDLG